MNLERAALASVAKGDEKEFLRILRDLLAPPDGESPPFVIDALNLISDRVLALRSTRPEAGDAEWRATQPNDSTRGVAWIDWDATHVGKIGIKGQRYILRLPTPQNEKRGSA